MKKIKFYYNTETLRFEKLKTPVRVKVLRVLAFFVSSVLMAFGIIFIIFRFIPNPQLRMAEMKYEKMSADYRTLSAEAIRLQREIALLEKRDNEVYRSIFEANPVPDSIRTQLQEQREETAKIELPGGDAMASRIANTLDNVASRIKYQFSSYRQIEKLIKDQTAKLASLPAIQPVSNRDLDRIASGFGMRIDPVYGTPKMHKGLDFTAPQGTPIYATGDARVEEAGFDLSGYGNHVILNHGYGYKTVFGHMSRIKVKRGQRVSRGEVIGYVGNTGKSTGPHCHYEVHLNGKEMNPVYFFYNDLTPEEFDRILKIASTGSAKSMD